MTFQPVAALPIDVSLWWIGYLRTALASRTEPYASGVHLGHVVPNPRRDRMVVVRRDGGNLDGVFDRPRISFDVWAKTEKDAHDLAALVIALAMDAAGAGSCVRVRHSSGPNSVADPSGQPRRLSLIEATHRAAVITTI